MPRTASGSASKGSSSIAMTSSSHPYMSGLSLVLARRSLANSSDDGVCVWGGTVLKKNEKLLRGAHVRFEPVPFMTEHKHRLPLEVPTMGPTCRLLGNAR